ncbi:MAG TPA: ABC transporter ATP-binding protein [Pseudolabrys sp.]|nr:ABC transporter ATP-binding protein [Pseudolabrys sp.]
MIRVDNASLGAALADEGDARHADGFADGEGSRPALAPAPDLLRVENLSISFKGKHGLLHAVDNVSYTAKAGEIVALVGESGCGKSVSSMAIMRLLPKSTTRITGRVMFEGRDLLTIPERDIASVRGREIAMIFQDPMTSLNPVLSIGLQLSEPLMVHMGLDRKAARARAAELLTDVGIADAERRLDQYPHQLSGGMRQRVMIAMALTCNPKLIIADEPTTALDVTIQAQILNLLYNLSRRLGIGLIFITHNLGIVARYADRVNVMYAGRLIEQADTSGAFTHPKHFYTLGLLNSIPRLDRPRTARLATIDGIQPNLLNPPTGCRFAPRCVGRVAACEKDPPLRPVAPDHYAACHRAELVERIAPTSTPEPAQSAVVRSEAILEVKNLAKFFELSTRGGRGKDHTIRALDGVTLSVQRGEALGLVGESGCGKSTLSRIVVGLEAPTAGEVRLDGRDISGLKERDFRAFSSFVQMVFQDPYSSLNPRLTVGRTVGEPLMVHGHSRNDARAKVADLLSQVGLHADMAERYPHELSGGQRQRVGIARALSMDPKLIICDEPVSALDVSVQAQVMNLLKDLRERLGLSYLFISHDLAVVRQIADRVAVMYFGRIMELADRDTLYTNPQHPYTRALLAAVPAPDPETESTRRAAPLRGEIPSPLNPPSGCVFHTRCPMATELCREQVPALREIGAGHVAACHYAETGRAS